MCIKNITNIKRQKSKLKKKKNNQDGLCDLCSLSLAALCPSPSEELKESGKREDVVKHWFPHIH